ncbi:MAG: hypothetical protein NXI10_03155 [bacterium]|nr:hypothetical protein [bacterium]
MRYLYFLLVLVFITGCAHGRLRLRKVDNKDHVEAVAKKEENTASKRTFVAKQDQQIIDPNVEEEGSEMSTSTSPKTIEAATTISTFDSAETQTEKAIETSSEEDDDDISKGQKVRLAIQAENDARKAKKSFIWSLVMFLSILVPFLAIIAPFSLIPFIIGTIKLNQSNKSDYITPAGERDARSARIMQLIYGVMLALLLLAITIIIIVFFL